MLDRRKFIGSGIAAGISALVTPSISKGADSGVVQGFVQRITQAKSDYRVNLQDSIGKIDKAILSSPSSQLQALKDIALREIAFLDQGSAISRFDLNAVKILCPSGSNVSPEDSSALLVGKQHSTGFAALKKLQSDYAKSITVIKDAIEAQMVRERWPKDSRENALQQVALAEGKQTSTQDNKNAKDVYTLRVGKQELVFKLGGLTTLAEAEKYAKEHDLQLFHCKKVGDLTATFSELSKKIPAVLPTSMVRTGFSWENGLLVAGGQPVDQGQFTPFITAKYRTGFPQNTSVNIHFINDKTIFLRRDTPAEVTNPETGQNLVVGVLFMKASTSDIASASLIK